MKNIILAIDQGTTSTRVVLIDNKTWEFIATHQIELPQHFPHPSHVEHDLNDIWKHTQECIKNSLETSKISVNQILAIGITNQRETTCAYDKKGKPLAKAIVWQDKRTTDFCNENKNSKINFKEFTGLPLDPYFSASKMRWLLLNNELVKKHADSNDLCLSTIDSFLLHRLTDGVSFKTDATNASRTQLYNLKEGNWDQTLLNFFGVAKNFLPEVCNTFDNFGVTKNCSVLPDGLPITCMIGDQQSALLGQRCTIEGMSKCTYGTGAFFLANTGSNIFNSKNGLLSTVAFRYQGKNTYALEGASFIAGAGVQWFRDQLKGIQNSKDIETEALKVKDISSLKNLFFFPFFSGLGSPYWKSEALASIHGMSRDTGIPELAYALLDGIAQSIADLKESVEIDLQKPLTSFHVDGGAAKNNLLMQLQANYLNLIISRPLQVETTVMGAALGAHMALNNIAPNVINSEIKLDKTFLPVSNLNIFLDRRISWKKQILKFYL